MRRMCCSVRAAVRIAVVLAVVAVSALPSEAAAQGFNMELVGQVGGLGTALAVEENRVYIATGSYVTAYDTTDTDEIRPLGALKYSETITHMDARDHIVWVAMGTAGVQAADFSFPTAPQMLGSFDTAGIARKILISGSQLFVADGPAGCLILNIANPNAPVSVGSFDTSGDTHALCLRSPLMYVADGSAGLVILDYSNPASPILLGSYDAPEIIRSVDESNELVIVGGGESSSASAFRLIDISDSSAPFLWGTVSISNKGVSLFGLIAMVVTPSGSVVFFDVSDPQFPDEMANFSTGYDSRAITLEGDRLYWVAGTDELRIYHFVTFFSAQFVGSEKLFTGGGTITTRQDYAYCVDASNNYALTLIDTSNSAAPLPISYGPGSSAFRALVPYEEQVLAASEYSGITAFDVSDPLEPKLIPANQGPPGILESFNTPGRAWNLEVRNTTAFIADGFDGLSLFDITDESNPQQQGHATMPGGAFDVAVSGDYAYVAGGTWGLSVVDVSDPALPMLLGTADETKFAEDLALAGTTVCIADREGGLKVIDAANPLAPVVVGGYYTHSWAVDVVVTADLAFVAASESGLQVLDISDPTSPVLVGSYDTQGTALGVSLQGLLAYVADDSGGMVVLRYTGPGQPPFDDSALVNYQAQLQMITGSVIPVTMRMRNTGNTTWSAAAGYSLAHACELCLPASGGVTAIDPGVEIAPGGEYVFTVIITAPDQPGPSSFAFQMQREGQGVFGRRVTLTPEIMDGVNDAEFVRSTIPAQMAPGQGLWVGIRFKNTGTSWWTTGLDHDMRIVDDPCFLQSGVGRISMMDAAVVAPGQSYQFLTYLSAPMAPGPCDLAFRMIQAAGPEFGQTYQVTVNVAEHPNAAQAWELYE